MRTGIDYIFYLREDFRDPVMSGGIESKAAFGYDVGSIDAPEVSPAGSCATYMEGRYGFGLPTVVRREG